MQVEGITITIFLIDLYDFMTFSFPFISQAVKKSRRIVGFLMQIKFIVEYTVMGLTDLSKSDP